MAICSYEPTGNTFTTFMQTIAKCCLLVSCKMPSNELLTILFDFHKKTYSGYNNSEIYTACEMLAAGELKNDEGKSPEHFQDFSPKYLSEVIIAYREYRGKVIIRAQNEIKKSNEPTPEQKKQAEWEANTKILNRILQDFDTETPEIFAIKFEVLSQFGIIQLTTEQKQHYRNEAKKQIRYEAAKANDIKTIREINSGAYGDLKSTARKLAYADFIKLPENRLKVENFKI